MHLLRYLRGYFTSVHDYSYESKKAVLASMHEKERVLSRPFKNHLGLTLFVNPSFDSDVFGTFTGEIERLGTPLEVAIKKARAAMTLSGLQIGIASEGSFVPDASLLGLASINHELLVLVDDNLGITVSESFSTRVTNHAALVTDSQAELEGFLGKVRFKTHGLALKPNAPCDSSSAVVEKGISNDETLREAFKRAAELSTDGKVCVMTDMRAHCNPLRRWAIRQVGYKLVKRLLSRCTRCHSPGWGFIKYNRGGTCRVCGTLIDIPISETHGCASCSKTEQVLLQNVSLAPSLCHSCFDVYGE